MATLDDFERFDKHTWNELVLKQTELWDIEPVDINTLRRLNMVLEHAMGVSMRAEVRAFPVWSRSEYLRSVPKQYQNFTKGFWKLIENACCAKLLTEDNFEEPPPCPIY